jgi:3D (Asp-Asp-Asp) domain-containing protein
MIIKVKTSIMLAYKKRHIIAATLVTILFTIIVLIAIGKVLGNSNMGVYKMFYIGNLGDSVPTKTYFDNLDGTKKVTKENKVTEEKGEYTELNDVYLNEIEFNKDNKLNEVVTSKIRNSNKKIKDKIKEEKIKKEKIKKAKLEKEKVQKAKLEKKEFDKVENDKKQKSQQYSTNQSSTNQNSTNYNQTNQNKENSQENYSNNNSKIPAGWREYNMVASAYDLSYESCGKTPDDPNYGITYSGTRAKKGRTIAVDPSVIPLGSEVYVEIINPDFASLSGYYIAEDTGGAIKGNRIDIFVGDSASDYAYRFGMQYCKVYMK